MRTAIQYTPQELDFISTSRAKELSNFEIARSCNAQFHGGRSIRTARGIEYALDGKLKKSKRHFTRKCAVCFTDYQTSWPLSRYCSEVCKAVIDREYATKKYRHDPIANVKLQTERVRARIEIRWVKIFESLGRTCSQCKIEFPRVVYDLHHPLGKRSRKDTPSRIIRAGTDADFERLLNETILLCANCHRLHHAETGDWGPRRT